MSESETKGPFSTLSTGEQKVCENHAKATLEVLGMTLEKLEEDQKKEFLDRMATTYEEGKKSTNPPSIH